MNNLFYSSEEGKYFTYPDGDEATGIQIREVIEANEKVIGKLQQENEQLKKQYCERTDCAGRIGISKKVEELQNKIQQLKKQLEDKEDFINKLQATKDKLDKWNYESTMKQKEFIKYLEDMLDDENDIFSVVRVKDLLQKYKEVNR